MAVLCSRALLPTLSSHRSPLHPRRLLKTLHFTFTATCKASSLSSPTPTSSSAYDALSPRQKSQISLFVDALLQWNQRMNLTAVTEESEVMTRHVEDSLAVLAPLQQSYLDRGGGSASCDGLNLVDVGSGAGLPGLILAIARPRLEIHSPGIDAKTLLVLRACCWAGRFVECRYRARKSRGQNAGQSADFREVYDVAVARAVAELRILAEYCLPLVRVGGLFVAAKGYDPQEEIRNAQNAIRLLGGSVIRLCDVASHGPFGQRTAVICLKDRATPRKYPRAPGIPSKMPL